MPDRNELFFHLRVVTELQNTKNERIPEELQPEVDESYAQAPCLVM